MFSSVTGVPNGGVCGGLEERLCRGARCALAVLGAALVPATPGFAHGGVDGEPCSPGGGQDPTPTAVTVTTVPIVVASTTADYFVLYVKHEVDGAEVEQPDPRLLGRAVDDWDRSAVPAALLRQFCQGGGRGVTQNTPFRARCIRVN